jgi:hypothetical protein
MNYSSMLSFLQNLLTTQQGTNASQFSQNLGFNQQQLAQQGNEFNANLAAQQTMQQAGIQGQIAVQAPQLQTQKDINSANNANSLALQTAPLAEQNKEFTTTSGQTQQQIDLAKQLQMWQQQMALNQMNYDRSLTPGSATWNAIQSNSNQNMKADEDYLDQMDAYRTEQRKDMFMPKNIWSPAFTYSTVPRAQAK